MSNFNLNWLTENIHNTPIIFDIGCADMTDTINIKNQFPKGILYAFECAEIWRSQNLEKALINNIRYFHTAISDNTGVLTFYPSLELDGIQWPWSGSICEPGPRLISTRWVWETPYDVNSITLNDFCKKYTVVPDVIHIDVQGAEFKVFNKLDNYIRPKFIWAEISEFHMYKTGNTYIDFKNLMISLGYREQFKDNCDALYVLNNIFTTEYIIDV